MYFSWSITPSKTIIDPRPFQEKQDQTEIERPCDKVGCQHLKFSSFTFFLQTFNFPLDEYNLIWVSFVHITFFHSFSVHFSLLLAHSRRIFHFLRVINGFEIGREEIYPIE